MKPKVCLTTLEFPPDIGGVGESTHRIARMLIDLGYDVHVAVFRAVFRTEKDRADKGDFGRSSCVTTEQDGITVHRLFPAVRSTVARIQDYLCDIYGQLETLQRQHQFDLLHAFFINEMGFLTTLLAKENGIPVINSIRGADLHKHVFSPQQLAQVSWALENSDWVTFVSQDLMKRARVLVPQIASKSSAFLNSIYPISLEGLPKPKMLDRLKGTVIGSVGNFRDKKGLEYLFDACQNIQEQSEITLLFVGDFVGKEMGYWQKELANSNLTDRVVITGKISREEALAYLPYMDIFAIPSLHDGCPNALLEAMMAQRAIVGTNVDAIGEILEDGINGLLVNPRSSEELERALQQLISQPELRQKLGAVAQKTVFQKLNPEVEKQNWANIYQTILDRPSSHNLETPLALVG
ncbi:MAG: glycosyltransferase [Geitlerinemataceae cyanobacterium]